jgi:hypothetical protein
MRNFLLTLVVVISLLASCKKDVSHDTVKKQNAAVNDSSKINFTLPDTILTKYNASYNSWLDFKQKYNNSYVFVLRSDYSEPQFHTLINTKVQNGVVVSRDFFSITYIGDPPNLPARSDTTVQWHEAGATLNTHAEAGPPMTLDYIYSKAKSVWLNVDPEKNTLYLDTKNNGLISVCGYYPNGCQDNCFTGIYITSVTAQ